MIEFVFFDLDGVIRIWDSEIEESIERRASLPSGSIREIAFASDLLLPAISGLTTDEEWRAAIAARLQHRFPHCGADLTVERWSHSPGAVDRDVMEIIGNLDPRLRVGLITNATSRLSADLKQLGIRDCFHAITNSSEIGFPKPDEAIFRHTLARHGIAANQAFFIDDSRENVLAAAIGIAGHVFETASTLLDELQRRGLLKRIQ